MQKVFNLKFLILECIKKLGVLSLCLLLTFAYLSLFSCESRSVAKTVVVEGEASNPIVNDRLILQLGSADYHLNAKIIPESSNDTPVYAILNSEDVQKAISLNEAEGTIKAIGFAKQATVRISSSKNSKIYKDIFVTVADDAISVNPSDSAEEADSENQEVVVPQGSSIDLNPASGKITNISLEPSDIFIVQQPDAQNPVGRITLSDDVAEEDIGKLVTVTIILEGDNAGTVEYDFVVGEVIPVASIELAPTSLLLAKDDVDYINVTVLPQNSTYKASKYIEYSTTDENVATAALDDSNTDLIKVTATTDDTTKTCSVTARSKKHPDIVGSASVLIKATQIPSGVNNTVELPIPDGTTIASSAITPEGFGTISGNTFEFSSNPAVPDGTLVKVTVELSDGSTRTYEIIKGQVVSATAITPSASTVELKAGESQQITFTFAPQNATYKDVQYLTFTSSDESIATVSANGTVTLKSDAPFGQSATITATSRDGVSSQFTVVNNSYTPTTENDIETGDLNTLTLSASEGKTFEGASLACTPANAVGLDSTTGVLTISPSVANGTLITCTITYSDDSTEKFSIVKGAVIPLDSISAADLEIIVGESDTITPVFTPSNATYQGWSLVIQSDSNYIIDTEAYDLDNGLVAIVDNNNLNGNTATLTLSSDKYPELTYPITIKAVALALLSGEFSVSETKKVRFAKGNLYWDGYESKFKTENNQYDFRTCSGNKAVLRSIYGSVTTTTPNMTVGLFYYSKDITKTYSLNYDDNTEKSVNDSFAIANGGAIRGFDVLSKDEWQYLITSRDSAIQKYGLATISLSSTTSVKGLVLLPEDWNPPTSCSSFTHGTSNYTANVYDINKWWDMENAGAVFIPVTGYRNSSELGSNPAGFYHSSTHADSTNNSYVFKFDTNVTSLVTFVRHCGIPVRLVKAV